MVNQTEDAGDFEANQEERSMTATQLEEAKRESNTITFLPSGTRQNLEKRVTLLITILPFLGFGWAVSSLWGRGIGWIDVFLLVSLYSITGLGVTIGYHRMLTHRSFDASKPVKVLLAIAGSMAVEGSVISWVADHRRHHAFADKPGDPHSPHLEEAEGISGVLRGLWHAHIGWFFDRERTNIERFAPDLQKDRSIVIVSALFPLWVVLSLLIPALAGLIVTGTLSGALGALVWGAAVRIFFFHHVSWSINSICHFYGRRPFESHDLSTNNWIMSLLAFGEGWHNNHHAFPSSAIHGLERWQFDMSGIVIRIMGKLRLVRNLKMPTARQLEMKRAV